MKNRFKRSIFSKIVKELQRPSIWDKRPILVIVILITIFSVIDYCLRRWV